MKKTLILFGLMFLFVLYGFAADSSYADEHSKLFYGEISLEEVLERIGDYSQTPWKEFKEANDYIKDNNYNEAIAILDGFKDWPYADTKTNLMVWKELDRLGHKTRENELNDLQGIVLKLSLDVGDEYFAVYSDGLADYLHYEGNVLMYIPDEVEAFQALKPMYEKINSLHKQVLEASKKYFLTENKFEGKGEFTFLTYPASYHLDEIPNEIFDYCLKLRNAMIELDMAKYENT